MLSPGLLVKILVFLLSSSSSLALQGVDKRILMHTVESFNVLSKTKKPFGWPSLNMAITRHYWCWMRSQEGTEGKDRPFLGPEKSWQDRRRGAGLAVWCPLPCLDGQPNAAVSDFDLWPKPVPLSHYGLLQWWEDDGRALHPGVLRWTR